YAYRDALVTACSRLAMSEKLSRSKCRSRKLILSVRITVEQDRPCRCAKNPDVEPERPVVDIFFVELDPTLCPLDGAHLAPEAFDLRVARNAGLYAVPTGIAPHRFMIE